MRGSLLLEMLFPACCPLCGEPVLPKGERVHQECYDRLGFITDPICFKCGRKLETDEESLCVACLTHNPSYDAGRCTFFYHSDISNTIKEIKNNGTKEYVQFLCENAYKKHKDFLEAVKPQVICPIPLTKTKERVRGFNQSELLAYGLSDLTGIPVLRLLEKTRKTRDQKELGRRERIDNLSGAFSFVGTERTENLQRVLLVDDVFTTGSTMEEGAKVLKAAGIKCVYYICLGTGNI